MLLNRASRPTVTECWAACTASSSQSSMTTTVSLAPSPTRNSTLSAKVALPTWSSTTSASPNGWTSTSRCPKADPLSTPSPRSVTTVGVLATVSRGTVRTVAFSNDDQARAATRSAGTPARPRRASPRASVCTSTSGAGSTSTETLPTPAVVVLVQVPQAVQRGEPPVLLAAGGHVEVGQLERAVPLAPAVTGHRCRAVRVRLAAEPAGLRAEDLGGNVDAQPDSPFHLQLDEPVELQGVLHRELLGDRLDEAAHDHRHRLVLGQPAAHQVEELVVADLGDRGLVTHGHVVLADVDVRVGVAAADRVDEQRVALHRRARAVCSLEHLHESPVRRAPTASCHRLGDDRRGGVRRRVHHLGAGVLVLALAGEGDRERLALGVLAEQVAGGVLHGDLGADVAVDPLHPAARLHRGALGHQVVDVVRPVLDRRVADVGVLLHDDLDDRGVQRVGRVDRRRAALDVVHRGRPRRR